MHLEPQILAQPKRRGYAIKYSFSHTGYLDGYK
jgi:hypothetical protein